MSKKSFFISYNHQDEAWAEWIAWTIEDFGFKATIQVWDFIPGATWPQEMHQALEKCSRTVCVLSPAFLASDMTAAEWQAVFAEDPVGRKRKLVLARVSPCEPTGLLRGRIYVDLVGQTRQVARARLRRAIEGRRGKPISEPAFPGGAPGEPAFPQTVVVAFVLPGDGHIDEGCIASIQEQLRRLTGDQLLTVASTATGSIILTIVCSKAASDVLESFVRDQPKAALAGRQVLGYWPLSSLGVDPVDDRVGFLRDRLLLVFTQFVADEDAKDLTQELLLKLMTSGDTRYAVLTNPANAAQMASSLLIAHRVQRDRDRAIRERVGRVKDGVPRYRILETAVGIYNRLPESERDALERFWTTELDGGVAADVLRENAMAVAERVEHAVTLALNAAE